MIHWTHVDAFNGDTKKMEMEVIKQSKMVTSGNSRNSKRMLLYAKFKDTAEHKFKPEIKWGKYSFDDHRFLVEGMMTGDVNGIEVSHFAKANEPCE